MKHFKFSIAILLCCSLLYNCEKNEVEQCANCRIKKIINYDNNSEEYLNTIYSYAGNQLTRIDFKYTKPLWGAYDSRHIITYLENKVIYIIETKLESEYKTDGMYEILSQDDNITEMVWYSFENGQYIESKKTVYEYDNSKLTTVKVFFRDNGEYKQFGKIEITYMDGKVDKFLVYSLNSFNELILCGIRRYEYINGILSNWVYSIQNESGEWLNVGQWIFHHSNGVITKIERLENSLGGWQHSPPIEYYYDSYNRLIMTKSDNAKTVVKFEEGQSDSDYIRFLPEDKFYYEPQF